ncbi:hypothetical protein [Desulfosporosinus sp. SB140]|uniref:hypothetical protein n=1 Tax=Desulfosporosinus paludis TaxID=3115649 RepID=UPI00388EB5BE
MFSESRVDTEERTFFLREVPFFYSTIPSSLLHAKTAAVALTFGKSGGNFGVKTATVLENYPIPAR